MSKKSNPESQIQTFPELKSVAEVFDRHPWQYVISHLRQNSENGNLIYEYIVNIFSFFSFLELRKAFVLFEKNGKNKMPARDLGALLRCLGWNLSERELEEVKHELVVSCEYMYTLHVVRPVLNNQ